MAPFILLVQSRSFPFPPLGSPHDTGIRLRQAEAQKKHMVHHFSHDLGEKPLWFNNNKGQHLESTYYILGAVLCNLCALTPLILITIL